MGVSELAARVPPLRVRGLTKSFKRRRQTPVHACEDISLEMHPGEIYGVLGANGSGKSTLIRIISTILLPDSGTVEVFGADVVKDPLRVRALINRVSADPSFFKVMSALENLRFFGRVYGLTPDAIAAKLPPILERLDLEMDKAREPIKSLSRGQQQKVAVARAFLTAPLLMLLDEPTTGLDPRSKRDVQGFIRTAQQEAGASILLTTHDMEEAELLCGRIAFLAGGQVVAEGSPVELKRRVGTDSMEDVFFALTGKSIEEDEDVDQPAG